MTRIVLPNGDRFVPQEWHDTTISTIPRHNDALATCRSCGAVRLVPEKLVRTPTNNMLRISELALRLRCSTCGAKNADLQFGYLAGDPPPL
ncbi:putative Zn finger protein [Rhizobium rosettiformans]|uniref:Putative Zn finger protein n=1 Tax=Rhizobium rosettiformans TaxID=1368430 RepID=A0A7W8MCI4_9HYPH|nr:putative Zn finger protein [Rhizobium rosettiformans]